ncbi:hypothetical protein B296_00008886 [Ensete ventricosum]|uniref:Secreted protein n=1 Tax=Ensete ventricosum TaxID=4639 RepID=A0A427BAT5_ENSVE|nr:hypothetical protein B296_00008886 [Ensete ventricosum]
MVRCFLLLMVFYLDRNTSPPTEKEKRAGLRDTKRLLVSTPSSGYCLVGFASATRLTDFMSSSMAVRESQAVEHPFVSAANGPELDGPS